MSFTTEEMTVLSAQMDEQLHALRDLEKHFKSGASKSGSQSLDEEQLLEKQRKEIKENAKESPDTFLRQCGNKAKEVLCKEGSELSKQWQKWGDIRNEDVLEKLGFQAKVSRSETLAWKGVADYGLFGGSVTYFDGGD